MFAAINVTRFHVCISAALVLLSTPTLSAQTTTPAQNAPSAESRTSAYRPETPDLSAVSPTHPLLPVIEYARREREYLRQTVHDFTCRLVKRERIDDILQDYNYIDMWVREEVRSGGRVTSPLSIFLEFKAPKNVAGRRVLFIDGRNEGKMLVRNGGKHFDYVVAKIDPYSQSAKDESLVPITQTGFNQLLGQMIGVLERHAAADPKGENVEVRRIAGAKIDKRPCHVIQIIQPKKRPGLEFHVANVFVDDELHIPARVDYSGWPAREGGQPQLIAEFTYTMLKVNIGLSEGMFDPRLLKAKR